MQYLEQKLLDLIHKRQEGSMTQAQLVKLIREVVSDDNLLVETPVETRHFSFETNADKYGVKVQHKDTTPRWQVRKIYHLSPDENRSRHNAFVKVFDQNGQRDRNPDLRIAWMWDGGPLQKSPLDKQDNSIEWGHGDVSVEKNMTVTLWIDGDGVESEAVGGIHCRHDDERGSDGDIFNSIGHHSFLIEFQKVT